MPATEGGGELLPGSMIRFVSEARRAVLATVGERGQPRLVPICFVLEDGEPGRPVLWTPIDEKPKRALDPMALARVRDILARPHVEVLVDRWDEDWSKLAWVRVGGQAEVVRTAPAQVVDALRAKYPQYRDQGLERRPAIRISIDRTRSWGSPP
jgi:PPOX class probable F420-dependent enzyme